MQLSLKFKYEKRLIETTSPLAFTTIFSRLERTFWGASVSDAQVGRIG